VSGGSKVSSFILAVDRSAEEADFAILQHGIEKRGSDMREPPGLSDGGRGLPRVPKVVPSQPHCNRCTPHDGIPCLCHSAPHCRVRCVNGRRVPVTSVRENPMSTSENAVGKSPGCNPRPGLALDPRLVAAAEPGGSW
jgi:hypothetical protein